MEKFITYCPLHPIRPGGDRGGISARNSAVNTPPLPYIFTAQSKSARAMYQFLSPNENEGSALAICGE